MPFVQVVALHGHPQRAQHAHAADAQHDLLRSRYAASLP